MASFQDKIGCKMMRKIKNKNYRSVSFLPNEQQNIPKKLKKLKNIIMNSFQAKIGWKKMRKREIKIIVPFHSYPSRDRIFQKNGKKVKKLKNIIVASF